MDSSVQWLIQKIMGTIFWNFPLQKYFAQKQIKILISFSVWDIFKLRL